MCMFCRSLFVLLYVFLLVIVLSVHLRFTDSDYPTISLEMPVPSQGHYGFHSFRLLTDFVCLYDYEF
jgi:hypothetical protein